MMISMTKFPHGTSKRVQSGHMANVSEIIPDSLQPEVDAALAWFNSTQADAFEVTGIIDADLMLATGIAVGALWRRYMSAAKPPGFPVTALSLRVAGLWE
jgi:hypothetical protein